MLQQIRELFSKHKATAATSYVGLVQSLADSKPMPDNAVDIAIAAGKSVQDLEADVAMLSGRRLAAVDLAKVKTLRAEVDRKGEASATAYREVEAIEARFRQELDAARKKYHEIQWDQRSLHGQADSLERSAIGVLVGTADPAITQEIAALHQRKVDLRNEVNRGATAATMPIKPADGDTVAMDRYTAALNERQEWLASVEREEVAINQQIQDLEARRLDPAACAIG